MLLTVLGSGTCELRAARSSPAYLLEAGHTRLMLDLGQGAWRRLAESGRAARQVDGVIISHPHPDHMADLVPLLFALKYDPLLAGGGQMKLLAHHGLQGLVQGLDQLFSGWLNPPPEVLQRMWLHPGQGARVGQVEIKTISAEHHSYSLAWRLECGGSSLAYLGDSAASDSLAEFARGADLLVAHCAGTDQNPKPGHLYPRACGIMAARAGAGALLLSHLYREVDPEQARESAAANFSGPVWAAFDGLALRMGRGETRQEQADS